MSNHTVGLKMGPTSATIIILLFVIFPTRIRAVLFSTKAYAGSTCIHDLETASSMRLDRGELGAFVARSVAVHVTNHGVRFILPVHHIRQGGMQGWTSMDCIQSTDPKGSLCSIPSTTSGTQTLGLAVLSIISPTLSL